MLPPLLIKIIFYNWHYLKDQEFIVEIEEKPTKLIRLNSFSLFGFLFFIIIQKNFSMIDEIVKFDYGFYLFVFLNFRIDQLILLI